MLNLGLTLFVRLYLSLYLHVFVDSPWELGTKKVPLIRDGWGGGKGKETGGVIEKESF